MYSRTVMAAAMALGLGALLTLSGCGASTVVASPDGTMLNTVTTSGTGKTVAPPDMAEMTFGAGASAPEADVALATVSETAEAIADAVREAGVAGEDIQTANVSVYPEYEYREGTAPRVTGYRAAISVQVKIRDLADVGEVIAAASNAGANEINGPNFTLDDDVDANSEAITLAVADARTRAEAMASAAGKSLGAVKVMTETDVSAPPIWGDKSSYALRAEFDSVPVEIGQLDITARVTVVFGLE